MSLYDDCPIDLIDPSDIIEPRSIATTVQVAYRGDALTENEKALLKSCIDPGTGNQIIDLRDFEGLYEFYFMSYKFSWNDIENQDILFLYERIIYINVTRNLCKDTIIFYPSRYAYIAARRLPRGSHSRLFAYNNLNPYVSYLSSEKNFEIECDFLESIASLFLFNPRYIGELNRCDTTWARPHRLYFEEWNYKLDRMVKDNNEDFRVVRINQTHYVEIKNLSQIKEMIKEDNSYDKSRAYYYPVISYPDTDIHHIYLAIKYKTNTAYRPLQENMIVYAFIDSFNHLYRN